MDTSKDTLILADCLTPLKYWYEKGHKEFIDLCYIDPPFNSKRDYNIIFNDGMQLSEEAFTDIWSRTKYTDELDNLNVLNPDLYSFLKLLDATKLPKSYLSYLTIMGITCWYIRETLKPTGSFYFHCDPTMSHYVKIMLDYIFGMGNFRNEIVWCYDFGGRPKNYFPRKHDILLWYSKGDTWTFNTAEIDRLPYKTEIKGRKNPLIDPAKYEMGKIPPDWWDMPIISIASPERKGYPTQKPEALLERIIKASTNPTDLVADFFMGGGTTVATAAKCGRRYLGTDINERAIQITQDRLASLRKEPKKDFIIQGIPKSSKQLKNMLDKGQISKYDFQDMICKYYLKVANVIPSASKSGDDSIDGTFGFTYQSKPRKGYVQVTTSANKNHLKAFCLQVSKQKPHGADMGVYISFDSTITDGMRREAKAVGKIDAFDRVQILTVEDLVDKGTQFNLPQDVMTI